MASDLSAPIRVRDPVNRRHWLNQGLVSWWLPLPATAGGPRLFDPPGGQYAAASASGVAWSPGLTPGLAALKISGSGKLTGTLPQSIAGVAWTVAATFATTATGGSLIGFGSTGATDQSLMLVVNNATSIEVGFYGDDNYFTTPYSPVDGQIHRLVVAVTAAGSRTVWLDGIQCGAAQGSHAYSGNLAYAIGARADQAGNQFAGTVGDIKLLLVAATPAWAAADYLEMRAGFPATLSREPRTAYSPPRVASPASGACLLMSP